MSDPAKSKNKRILVVSNPSPESDGEDEQTKLYTTWPHPLSRPIQRAAFYNAMSHHPPPNLSPDSSTSYFPPGSWSNPALSSPSSSDSRAYDTTPPPVAPTMASPRVDLLDDSPIESAFPIGSNVRTDTSLQLPHTGPQP